MGHRLALTTFALLLVSGAAWAQPDPPAPAAAGDDTVKAVEALAEKAKAHYAAGEFSDAVATYLEAYRVAPAAIVLYNIAHIYDRKLNEPDLAADFYRRYISAPDADPAVVQKATARLQTLRAEKARRDAAALAPPKTTTPASPDAPRVATTTRPKPDNRLQIAGIASAGVGVLLIGGGVFMGLQASDSQDAFERSVILSEKQALRDDGRTQALTADVLYGVGAAAMVGGLMLILLQPDADDTAVQVAPTGDLRGATVLLGGAL